MGLSSDNIDLFLAVVDHGSFSAAARALNRVPSAVSMGIANIEAELGYPLFDRSRREPAPTAQAHALIPHARQIASRLRLLQAHAIELSDDLESSLTVGVAAGVDRGPLLDAVAEIAERHPLLPVEIADAQQDDVREMLHSGAVDLALMFAKTRNDREEVFLNVAEETFVAVASATVETFGLPADLRRLEDLAGARQITVSSLEQELTERRLVVSDAYWRTNSAETALGLVERGVGWANLPLPAVWGKVAEGTVRVMEFENLRNGLAMPVQLVWLRGRPLRKAAGQLVARMGPDRQAGG
ncbi:LysR family transcriptional regulator [Nocardiopsis sp. CT-R113]|uniref:LysR family transcriptional regulator n=1 Tax=Nocardiopsis codii TaxID=3065942 RepID=A0ABU7K732_9ACTN|nr:LysR family transcriptional regulator [Nocardiopsis sp. CT-R113]MEE2038060.1 LysR family transcriptional regulator [Nocardiopsis sp. CT-R113]